MSRAQTVRLACNLAGLALALALFLLLPFGAVTDFVMAAAAWLILGAIGERHFRRHAGPAEIRADLEDRRNAF